MIPVVENQLDGVVARTFSFVAAAAEAGIRKPAPSSMKLADVTLSVGIATGLPFGLKEDFEDPDGDAPINGATVGGVYIVDTGVGLGIDAAGGAIPGTFGADVHVRGAEDGDPFAPCVFAVTVSAATTFELAGRAAPPGLRDGELRGDGVDCAVSDSAGYWLEYPANGLEGLGLGFTSARVVQDWARSNGEGGSGDVITDDGGGDSEAQIGVPHANPPPPGISANDLPEEVVVVPGDAQMYINGSDTDGYVLEWRGDGEAVQGIALEDHVGAGGDIDEVEDLRGRSGRDAIAESDEGDVGSAIGIIGDGRPGVGAARGDTPEGMGQSHIPGLLPDSLGKFQNSDFNVEISHLDLGTMEIAAGSPDQPADAKGIRPFSDETNPDAVRILIDRRNSGVYSASLGMMVNLSYFTEAFGAPMSGGNSSEGFEFNFQIEMDGALEHPSGGASAYSAKIGGAGLDGVENGPPGTLVDAVDGRIISSSFAGAGGVAAVVRSAFRENGELDDEVGVLDAEIGGLDAEVGGLAVEDGFGITAISDTVSVNPIILEADVPQGLEEGASSTDSDGSGTDFPGGGIGEVELSTSTPEADAVGDGIATVPGGGDGTTGTATGVGSGINRDPTTLGLADLSMTAGVRIHVNLGQAFDDPDGDALNITVDGLPEGLAFDGGTGLLTGAAAYGEVGARTVTVAADDGRGGNVVSETFSITVVDPVLNLVVKGRAELVPVDVGVEFLGDGLGGAATYSAPDLLGTGLSISEAGILSGTFTAARDRAFTVMAEDESGAVVEKHFAIKFDDSGTTLNGRGVVVGTDIDDLVFGTSGDPFEYVYGGDGDDTFHASAGSDHVRGFGIDWRKDGDDGHDAMVYEADQLNYSVEVRGWFEFDSDEQPSVVEGARLEPIPAVHVLKQGAALGAGADDGLRGIEEIRFAGESFSVTSVASEGDDLLIPPFGADGTRGVALEGRGGNDRIVGGVGDDILVGGAGGDVIEGNLGDDTIHGNTPTDPGGAEADIDVAFFATRMREFDVTTGNDLVNGEHIVRIIVDDREGNLGRDTLFGVEKIRFLDRTVDTDDLPRVSDTPLSDVILTSGMNTILVEASDGFAHPGGGALIFSAAVGSGSLASAGIGLTIDADSGEISGVFTGTEAVTVTVRSTAVTDIKTAENRK